MSKQISGGRALQVEGAVRAKALRQERAQTAAVRLEWPERRLWWEMRLEKKGGGCLVDCWKYFSGWEAIVLTCTTLDWCCLALNLI